MSVTIYAPSYAGVRVGLWLAPETIPARYVPSPKRRMVRCDKGKKRGRYKRRTKA